MDLDDPVAPLDRDGEGPAVHAATLKHLRETRAEAEARFQLMADNAPVLLWMSGVDAGCTFFNQGWLRFTGRTMEQECGAGWSEGVHPDDLARCLDVYLDAFARRDSFQMDYRLRRADGAYRWICDRGVPRFEPDGSFAGYVGSAIDITHELEARDALTRLTEAQHENEQRLKRRVAQDLHDGLGQLLTGIGYLTQALVADAPVALQPRLERLTGLIHSAVQRTQEITARLASAAQDCRPLKDRLIDLARLTSETFPVRCTLEAGADLSDLDPESQFQVLMVAREAVTNSVRHAECRNIEIVLSREGPGRRLVVRDDGKLVAGPLPHRGLGIGGMEYRARLLAGRLDLQVRPEGGLEVRLDW